MHDKHPRHKKYLKKGMPLGMNELKRFNLKGQIHNEIKSSYLGHLSVGLI
jgi:hypothetical protein